MLGFSVMSDTVADSDWSIKGREKSAMYVEDLAKVVETVISTTKKKFGHRQHRIELCGPHRIVIEFTFEFTKEFLGAKDENTFILPEIIFDPSLILSPHVFLLGLLFADRAFARVDGEEVLMSAEQLLRLRIPDECNELQLTLDPALDNIPVFRQSERTLEGITISLDKALPYSTLLPWVKKVGAITGFRQVSRPYSLRYGAGKALDNSGSVSDALRNLIMHHADTRTFLKYYLHRRIDKDLAAIIRGLDPQEDMMRAACRMSRTIDPKRPQELTTAQSSSVNQQPEIQDLIQWRGELRRQLGRPLARHRGTVKYEVYQKLNQELAGARQRARDALLAQLQEKYDREQPMLEIQRQLSGTKLAETVNQTLDYCEELPAPQKRLIETILLCHDRHWRTRCADGPMLLTPLPLTVYSRKGSHAVSHGTNVPLARWSRQQSQKDTTLKTRRLMLPKAAPSRISCWRQLFDRS
ncbi:C2H2 finger domain protein [Rasamsonia emersonii CBS 393.64]|uniref:C2H2 finger domain protein n=1 Tax=Rasamsonia emersonii (strain ATCC 16479 / CBS 393.64 / IMI 116815) TaxID=1408163 RepID=A0A0F4YDD9_RASE3|nr:C2H2 finger domain protein [Rasamsonia emersonii CBS 393.64]KKA16204.1 C2H2 finger domain protein [Rasamsonia emersonii CBS 393.64]